MRNSKVILSQRFLAALLALLMVMSLVACGGTSSSSAQNNSSAENQNESNETADTASTASTTAGATLNMGTGGTGQGLYAMGAAISNAIRHHTDFQVTAQTTAGSVANVELLATDQVDMVIVSSGDSDVLASIPDAQMLFVAAPYAIQFGMLPDSNYSSIEDMKGCRFAVPTPGTGGYTSSAAVFDALGLTFEEYDTAYMSVADSTEAYKDGKLDVMGQISTIPHPGWYEVSTTGRGIDIYQFTDEEMNAIMEKYPDYAPITIPAGTYGGQEEDIETLGIWSRIICTADMSEDLAYAITKVMAEQHEEIVQGYGQMEDATVENTLTIAETGAIPLHPGAVKYFQEIGAM